ncbi:MAG: PLP-dependent transferase [Fimbriimonadaceae bacterium]|nr:PLP-dependent transferase [Fimbriimonadaceae bacterium]
MDIHGEASPDTLLQHFGEEEKYLGAVAPPLIHTSTFVFNDVDTFISTMQDNPGGPPWHYSRVGNPTVAAVENKLAALEHTEACKMFGNGMGAITACLFSCIEAGSHVVAVDTCYGTTRQVFEEYLPRFNVSHTYVSGLTVESVLDAVTPETSMIYLEAPSSLIFRLQDIEPITKYAREKGIPTLLDNTYSSPLHMNPADHGVDMVIHSCTKYLAGHSDTCSGAVCTTQERVDRLAKWEVNFFGSVCSPFNGWMVHRGLRTLRVRLKQHELAGNIVADYLAGKPAVDKLMHVGHETYPQRELYKKYCRGSGGLLSFVPTNQDPEYVKRLCNALKLFRLGVSWGGHESLVVPLLIKPIGWNAETYVIRLFCGLEDPADMIKDLEQAFDLATVAV